MDTGGRSPEQSTGGSLFRRWFSRIFPKPRIFISYAREDSALATWLFDELVKSGFDVYLDTRGTLLGERFLAVIVQHLRQCDAVIALTSPFSAESAWCQAEMYYAHALQRPVLPIRTVSGQELMLPGPLELLQRETHYILAEQGSDNAEILANVQKRFQIVRRRARWRWLRRGMFGAVALALIAWGLHSGFSAMLHAWERSKLLTRLERAQLVLTRDAVEESAQKFRNDETLRTRLLSIADDRERATNTRLNALILGTALGNRENRWYLESVQWRKSSFGPGELTEVTFRTGSVQDVVFQQASLSGVFWNSGPDFAVSGSTFAGCRFYGGDFRRTSVIDVDFENCLFFGMALEISGFGAVRFTSKTLRPDSEVITGGEVSIFENAIIANCTEPPPPGTLDFGGPKNEVEFNGVVFESCRFRGFIRPAWFTGCHFSNCIFPPSLAISDLEKRGNTATDCVNLNERCE